jgi:hypothetical protein
VLDQENLGWVPAVGDRIELLRRVERTARARGQTDVANDARFEWLRLSGDSNHDVLDLIVYRETAGYLVKPIYPLRALLILVVVASLVRAIAMTAARRADPTPEEPPPDAAVPSQRPAGSAAAPDAPGPGSPRFAAAFARSVPVTLAVVVPRLPKVSINDLAGARSYLVAVVKLLEWVAVKALLVLVLLCVANANPTLHQFIEALVNR